MTFILNCHNVALSENDNGVTAVQTPLTVSFLLIRLLPLYCLILATEVLRLANRYAGKRLFEWHYSSLDGLSVEASNSTRLAVEHKFADTKDVDYLIVVAGYDALADFSPAMKQMLQRLNRQKVVLGAIDSGAFILAEAQLLQNQKITLHPTGVTAFTERYRTANIEIQQGDMLVTDRRISCAGGLSVVPMMLHLVGQHGGEALVHAVAHDMQINPVELSAPDTGMKASRVYNNPSIVGRASLLMRTYVEEPLSIKALAKQLGVSERSLFRKFQTKLGMSPNRYYVILRLQHAQHLLLQSQCSMTDVAFASGFSSSASLSRAFKREFGISPKHMLGHVREHGYESIVPEGQLRNELVWRATGDRK
jgi:AraC family carnitine catabolism transcriptional activator